MLESPSDSKLIAGCIEGRKESWDRFVDQFSRLIYWSIQKTLETSSYKARGDLAHEVFQECFERLLEKKELETLRNIDSIRKFLTIMASHMTMDKIRSIARHENRISGDISSLEEFGLTVKEPTQSALSNEQAVLVATALSELSPKQRLCVEWYYVDGKTHREISEILGLPIDTVSATIRRAREKIKQFFLENDK